MAFLKESQGHLGNLGEKSRVELVDLLQRQEKLLQNRAFVNSLKDKGQKIKEFAEELKRIVAEKDEVENAILQFESMSLRSGLDDKEMRSKDSGDKTEEKREVRMIEKIQEQKAKIDPVCVTQKKGTFKPHSSLRSDVTKMKEAPEDSSLTLREKGDSRQMDTNENESLTDVLGKVTDEVFRDFENLVSPFILPPEKKFIMFNSEQKYKLFSVDMKTNSSGSDAEICQISAVSSDGELFSEYCLPAYMSKGAVKSTGLAISYKDGRRILTKNGQEVDAHSRSVALKRFTQHVSQTDKDVAVILIDTTDASHRRTLLYNLRTFSIPAPKMYFANCVPLFKYLRTCGKISAEDSTLISVHYSLFNYKFDISDSLVTAQAIHKVLNDPTIGLTTEGIVSGSQCVSLDYALADLNFMIDKRKRLSSLRGKLFDSTVACRDVITVETADKIAASGLSYQDLETLYEQGKQVFMAVLARPPSVRPEWGARLSDDVTVLQNIYGHFVKKNRPKQKYEGVLIENPTGKASSAKIVSLDESFSLQKTQKAKLDELQAKQASARLANRANIKLQPFDPESAKSTREYREPVPEVNMETDSEGEQDYPD